MTLQDDHTFNLKPADYESIISAMGDWVTVQDREYRILYQNKELQAQFGCHAGSYCYAIYEGNNSVCPGCPVAKCFADGKIYSSERFVVINGEQRTLESTASPIKDPSGQVVAAVEVVRDVTQRKQTELHLTRFMNMYAALSHSNKAILESLTREEMFERVCNTAVNFGKFTLVVIGWIDLDGVVRSVAHCGEASRYLDGLVVHADARKEEGRGPTGRAIRDGVPYICNDFNYDPNTTPWRIAAQEHGIRASAAFPLNLDGAVVGALKVYSDHAGYFDAEIAELLTEMAANISFGLDRFLLQDQRRQSDEALMRSEERLKMVLEGSNDGYCDWHIPSSTVWMSNRYTEILGYAQGELDPSPKSLRSLVHPDDWPRAERFMDEEFILDHPAFEIEVRMLTKSGEWKWILYRGKVVESDKNGMTTRVSGTCTDVTEKKMYEEQLRYASTHDQLTGLYNRAFFDAEFGRLKVGRTFPVSIVMADIDGLKLVNDSYGHAEGDRLIKLAAQAMKDSFRGDDIVARIGGDEFAVLLSNADMHVVKEAIKRVLICQSELSKNMKDFELRISIGSATADDTAQLNDAFKLADSRMYYYKARRKSGVLE